MLRIIAKTLFCCFFVMVTKPLNAKDFTVVLDAGHGGHDSGAVGLFSKEKNINLAVTLEVGRLIEKNLKDVKVIYTRSTDVFVTLNQRANIANKANADLFISIHTNAVENRARSPQGAETYSLGLARSEANLAVAKRENSVILMEDDYKTRYAGFNPNSSESYIIFEFMQDKYMEQSVHMASLVQKQFSSFCGRVDKGVKQAGFLVLRETSMPSILVEVGFISHKEEERYLNTDAGQKKIAEGIYRAFRQYKTEHDVRSNNGNGSTVYNLATADEAILKSDVSSSTPGKTVEPIRSTSSDILFKVQILASNTPIKQGDAQFKGLKPVEYYEENGFYKYTYGSSKDYNAMVRQRKQILSKFGSAFIVAFRNGEKMDINQAIRIFKANKNN